MSLFFTEKLRNPKKIFRLNPTSHGRAGQFGLPGVGKQASKSTTPRWGGVTGVYNIIQTWGQLSFNRIEPLGPQQDPNLGSDELLLSKILGSFFQRKVYLGCNRTPTWGQVKYIRTPLIFTNSGCNTTPTWGQMNCNRTQSLGHSSREK